MSAFHLLTGTDFGRMNKWARRQPMNPLNAHIRKHLMTATTEMKLITRARFFSSGRFFAPGSGMAEQGFTNSENSVITPAEVEYNGIRLFSRVPQSAAEAEKINRALGHD